MVMECKVTTRKSHYPKDVPFEVPEGWALSTVIDVFQINPKNHEDDATEAGFVPMTKISDGFEDRFSFELKPWKSIKTGFTHFRNGDIAVAKISPCLENRKSFVVRGLPQEIGAGTTELFIFRSGQIIPEYGLLFFKSEFFISNCVGTFNGVVGQQRVARNTIEEMPFPIPPIREQKRIIQRVGSIFRMVSEVENSQTALKDSIEKSKARILDMAIHGKLVPQDPSEEPAIALLKRINPDFKASDNLHYIECPSGWAVTQMKSIIELLSGRDLENSRCNADGYGVPYLVGASCIDKGRISIYRWTETPEVISKEGDVLLSCKGTVGEVVLNTLGNLHIARQFMAIRSKAPQYILPDYLEILIKASIETLKKAARGIIPGISREDILELTVMIPPFEEQQRILSRIAEFNQSVSLIVANTCN